MTTATRIAVNWVKVPRKKTKEVTLNTKVTPKGKMKEKAFYGRMKKTIIGGFYMAGKKGMKHYPNSYLY